MIAPKGSIYNPIFPAAAEARFAQINRVIDLIYKALAPVLPNDIIAGSCGELVVLLLCRHSPERRLLGLPGGQ